MVPFRVGSIVKNFSVFFILLLFLLVFLLLFILLERFCTLHTDTELKQK